MEGKDFAKSKRRTTQRHNPRRGGSSAGSRHESALSRLDTNQDRYDEPDAAASGEPVPRSQGADLGALLSADHTEFRQRGSLVEETDALPTPSGADTAVLDLNIDLQALAASLSLLPIEAVLDLDACYCTDFATAPPDTTANVEGHANHSAVSASQNGISTQPGNHLDSTASHGKGSIIPRQQQLAKGLPASQGANNTHRAPNANVSTSSRSLQHTLANSATAEHDLSQTLAVGGAAQRGCMLQQHSDAGRSESSALQLPQQQDAGRPVPAGAQTAPPAEIEQDGHDAELDAILNAQGPDTTKPSSGVIEQPSKQEEGSLEDWLNSL